MLCKIPPSHWCQTLNLSPTEILAAQVGSWKELLWGAWVSATVLHQDINWAQALLPLELKTTTAHTNTRALLDILPNHLKESWLVEALAVSLSSENANYRLYHVLNYFQFPWSRALSLIFLEKLTASFNSEKLNADIKFLFDNLAYYISPEIIPLFLGQLPSLVEDYIKRTNHSSFNLDKALSCLKFRLALHRSFTIGNTP